MVHKKSEYSLQFHTLPEELRNKIWRDNIQLRESLISSNRSDHYWSDQLTNEWKCECDSDAEVPEEDVAVLVPPHRLKHKALLELYKSRKDNKLDGLAWSNDLPKALKEKESLHSPKTFIPVVDRDVGVQTPDWKEETAQDVSGPELKDLTKSLSLTSISGIEPLEKAKTTPPPRPSSAVPPPSHVRHPSSLPPSHPVRPITAAQIIHNQPETPDVVKSLRLTRSAGSYKSSVHIPTRTSRKAYFERKPSPFASYGWNDEVRHIGGKKTFNVRAPEREVYDHAVEALRHRREELKRSLDEEMEKRQRGLPKASPPVNLGSIWRTEYQDHFTSPTHIQQERYVRSRSAPRMRQPLFREGCH